MNSLKVEETSEAFVPFQVRGLDGAPVVEINDFLLHLATLGRSAYTLRSYARGLAHFFGWLRTSGRHADDVTRQMVGQYIADLGRARSTNQAYRHVPEVSPVDKDSRTKGSGENRRPRQPVSITA